MGPVLWAWNVSRFLFFDFIRLYHHIYGVVILRSKELCFTLFFFQFSPTIWHLSFRMCGWIIINYLSHRFYLFNTVQFKSDISLVVFCRPYLFLFLFPFGLIVSISYLFYICLYYYFLEISIDFIICPFSYILLSRYYSFIHIMLSSLQWYICISISLGLETSMNTSLYSLSFLD